jgi:hypothetical protein
LENVIFAKMRSMELENPRDDDEAKQALLPFKVLKCES